MARIKECQIVGGTDKVIDARFAMFSGVFKFMGGWGRGGFRIFRRGGAHLDYRIMVGVAT